MKALHLQKDLDQIRKIMKGNLINNRQIIDLIDKSLIKILPNFDEELLQIAQYPLTPKNIFTIEQGISKKVFSFNDSNKFFLLQPNTYYLIETFEAIILSKDIVGRFINSSLIIEKGLILSAGKIEFPYGSNNEKIRFGLYNALNNEVALSHKDRIAYVEFFDFRSLENNKYNLTKIDKELYNKRRARAEDDGPNYD